MNSNYIKAISNNKIKLNIIYSQNDIYNINISEYKKNNIYEIQNYDIYNICTNIKLLNNLYLNYLSKLNKYNNDNIEFFIYRKNIIMQIGDDEFILHFDKKLKRKIIYKYNKSKNIYRELNINVGFYY